MKFLLLSCVIATVIVCTCSERKCYVNRRSFVEGEKFRYVSQRTGCKYNCTCLFVGRRAYGNCTHKCRGLTYPPGCMPVYNPCGCAFNYTCIDGEKCQDPVTKNLYAVGEKWTNSTCSCNCLGNQKGAYRCDCDDKKAAAKLALEQPCVTDNVTTCYSCPTATHPLRGNPNCAKRAKCEQWPFSHRRKGVLVPMTCTCYGPRGFTQCVSRKKQKRSLLRNIDRLQGMDLRWSTSENTLDPQVKSRIV